MTLIASVGHEHLEARLVNGHFAFVGARDMARMLDGAGGRDDWDAFAESWNNLPPDTFMADGGRYRQRRHAAFAVTANGTQTRKPPQPHYQSRDRNPLNGGIERWFEPVLPEIADGTTMSSIFGCCREMLQATRPDIETWHTELHQFRILAKSGEAGQPTPEGMHRDGVDFVMVLLINRQNVTSGETTIADLDKQPLGAFTLSKPLDAAIVDDRYVYHGVTAITPQEPDQPAHRDVLVVTWKAEV